MNCLTINSNNGWQTLSFVPLKEFDNDGVGIIAFKLVIESRYWDRVELQQGNFDEIVMDNKIVFEQICIQGNKWNELRLLIDQWTSHSELFTIELVNIEMNYLRLILAQESNEYIISSEKPMLVIEIHDNKLKFQYHLIVDKTSFVFEPIENGA